MLSVFGPASIALRKFPHPVRHISHSPFKPLSRAWTRSFSLHSQATDAITASAESEVSRLSEVTAAQSAVEAGRWALAAEQLNRALDVLNYVPNVALKNAVRKRLARVHHLSGQTAKEVAVRKQISEGWTQSIAAATGESKLIHQKIHIESIMGLVNALLLQGESELAVEIANKAVDQYASFRSSLGDHFHMLLFAQGLAQASAGSTNAINALIQTVSSHQLPWLTSDTAIVASLSQPALPTAIENLETALKAVQAMPIPNQQDVAELTLTLGDLQTRQGNNKQAVDSLSKALKEFENQLGRDHYRVSRCVQYLGRYYHKQGDAVTSEGLYRSAISSLERSACPNRYTITVLRDVRVDYAKLLSEMEWNQRSRKPEADRQLEENTQAIAKYAFLATPALCPYPVLERWNNQ